MAELPFDTRFSLPAVDDPAAVEVGVFLLGLDAERLLAGLGVATLADDPTAVTLLVDQLRHGAPVDLSLETAVAAGARRWRAARPALAAADQGGPASASVRKAWSRAVAAVDGAGVAGLGPAGHAYLTACWLRCSEVDRQVEEAAWHT